MDRHSDDFRCPYDGWRMGSAKGEGYEDVHPEVAFWFYKCPNCGHEGVEAEFHDGLIKRRSRILCKCVGCRRERDRTGNIILEE